ncbi:hemerythrin domain-containing protein [Actinokineospora iranica]|uniref:Hemerythrin HHE cation binding domain-containing protein n=1 Tax=Actinokineospora iranica TaxID=1271860 RepID=A0A1G6J223_9PSEU|nr:hemerythrin domain-containing protein [Actinokineospora iranica]SDC12892.1 Hemerythrin HHE cation binding domain-containing protein [Actinokineospora iranica]
MSADVIELIMADHRRFEELFRLLRDRTSDRAKVLDELAHLLVAHAEAEEAEVYPALRRYKDIPDGEVDHGREEHAEGHQALLALMEIEDTEADAWEDALEELVTAINHHVDEEERTILNDARENVADSRRAELGERFVTVRDERIKAGCGELAHVREVAEQTKDRIDD